MSVSTGARTSALASFLLVGACMAGEDSAGKAELGTGNETPAAGTSGGGGAGVNINTRFQVKKLTTDNQAFQTADFTEPQLKDVWGVTSLDENFENVAQDTGLLVEVQPNGKPTGTKINLDKGVTGIENNESDRIQIQVKGKCGRAAVLVASQTGKLFGANPDVSTTDSFVLLDAAKVKAQFTGVALIPELKTQGGKDDGGGDDGHGGGGGQSGCSCDGSHGGNDIRQTVLAVDFHNGLVRGYNDQFQPINLGNRFQIPKLPKGFSPFGIKTLDDMVVVTAARLREPDTTVAEVFDMQVNGDGQGIVAAFDLTGKMMWRTQSKMFNIPWGLEMGDLKQCATGALLVGQHGKSDTLDGPGDQFGGTIIALDARTGKVITALQDGGKQPVRIQGLWGLTFGENISNFDQSLLHTGSGPDEKEVQGQPRVMHGLFARLDPR